MDIRRLQILIDGLDPTGVLYREFNPDWYWAWEEELLATIAQLIDRLDRRFASVYAKKGSVPKQPIHIPRPHRGLAKEKRKAGTTKAEFIAMVKRDSRG